jgi:hypothetical protein
MVDGGKTGLVGGGRRKKPGFLQKTRFLAGELALKKKSCLDGKYNLGYCRVVCTSGVSNLTRS